MAIEHQ